MNDELLKKYTKLTDNMKVKSEYNNYKNSKYVDNTILAIIYIKENAADIKNMFPSHMFIERASSILDYISDNIGDFDKIKAYRELRKKGIFDGNDWIAIFALSIISLILISMWWFGGDEVSLQILINVFVCISVLILTLMKLFRHMWYW